VVIVAFYCKYNVTKVDLLSRLCAIYKKAAEKVLFFSSGRRQQQLIAITAAARAAATIGPENGCGRRLKAAEGVFLL
jgi:hypothetical protein